MGIRAAAGVTAPVPRCKAPCGAPVGEVAADPSQPLKRGVGPAWPVVGGGPHEGWTAEKCATL